jgi:23S rRNA (uracil1939-C5)-methyltransferase
MSYQEELVYKRQRVEDALRRIGGFDLHVDTILGAENPQRYRNKAAFPIAQDPKRGVSVGFYRERSHDVTDIPACLIQSDQADKAGRILRKWMHKYKVPAYDERTGRGLIRHLMVRTNRRRESLICVVVNGRALPNCQELVQELRTGCPKAVGIVLNINTADTNVILGREYQTLWGVDYLEDRLCGLTFRLSVPSFFQVNRDQAEVLYQQAVDFADLTGQETVVDLYCGTGTITLAMARRAKQVIGVEVVAPAIRDAKENAQRNGFTNAQFLCADAAQAAKRFAEKGVHPNVISVDPPRKGLDSAVIDAIAEMAPERVVYVSCDPATLARDAKLLCEKGYRVEKAVAVDMFPRTGHVETVVLLSKGEIDSKKIRVEFSLEDMDMSEFQDGATYPQIKEYVLEHTGLKVSSLYISQIKRKCGIEVGKNYNQPKSEGSRQPQCPPEKEKAIRKAFKYFGMI